MKIYTRTGDDGSTGLFGGQRVSKTDRRIEAYGTVDELNAAIGLAAVLAEPDLRAALEQLQGELFVIGAHLATPPESRQAANLPTLDDSAVKRMEMQMDAIDELLPPLKNFILPGGNEEAARLHLARTICRRAERLIIPLVDEKLVPPLHLIYLNRLSDWFFVIARRSNHAAGIADIAWTAGT
jgi:cob(I)alamin adenosyltransferase